MLDRERVDALLDRLGLGAWAAPLAELVDARCRADAHGDMPGWLEAIDRLAGPSTGAATLDDAVVSLPDPGLPRNELVDSLKALTPWRKGPFRIGDILVDTEWRSDRKWARVAEAAGPLDGKRVLDVGSGNGYYGLRMLGAGAAAVLGIDPTLVYVAQFAALSRLLPDAPLAVLPLRLEELPPRARAFDSVFSMGVLYHSRAPIDHLRLLRDTLLPGGRLVLETIVLPGDDAFSKTPDGRYARMRNVWHLPSVPELRIWLARAGFRDVELHDVTVTTVEEQRSTEWMPFESLREALDPGDPMLTVEGWPAPHRAILTAEIPD